MYQDAEQTLATIRRDASAAVERAAAATRFRRDVDSTQGSARSRDRTIRATVDASGMVVDLEIADSALSRRGRDLAADIRRTIYDAQQDASRQVVELSVSTFGETSPVTDRMKAELNARFQEPDTTGGSWLTGGTLR